MARHYATRDFFRHMPNALLARYFQGKAVFGALDFAAMSETRHDELFAAWLALTDTQRNTMDAEFRDIFDLSCEKGCRGILDEAQWHLAQDVDPNAAYGLPSIAGEQKDAMRDLVLTGGPWSNADQLAILDYCETDVVALAHLLAAMQDQIDWPRALLRGRYMKAVSCIQTNGIPIDTESLALLQTQWGAIQDQLISDVDSDYGIYDGRTFKASRWEAYLMAQQIAWPRLASGGLDMCDATFRATSRKKNLAIMMPS